MSRNDIANYLGLAVETVSRLFTRFQDQGLIKVEGKFVQIMALEQLQGMISECSRNSDPKMA
jgi:CRP/FNR family transcriptional regulator